MIAEVGFGALIVAFIVAIYGIVAAVYGARRHMEPWLESGRRAMLLTWPLITLSVVCLVSLLVSGHYEVQYVYNVTSNFMPLYLKITALWGGQAGSLVFWSWLMAAFASAVTLRKWERDREFLPWVIVVTLVTLAFFLGLVIFVENPFVRFWQMPDGRQAVAMFAPRGAIPLVPMDGRGLNPLLRHPGMILHPPMLYLGFVSFVIPYAFGVAALITGRTDDRWIRITRRWTLVAWLFLSLGLILGSRWAYDVLGWGGYWGWDPVEIAAFMPWLSGTAFLHSVMIQEKRGLFKRWNMILVILTYALVIFGTFLTRSGVLSSVHAFAQSAIGPLFFGFIALTFAASMGLLLYRWNDLRSEGVMTSLLSREALFLLNNLLFMGILVVCFWGVIYPLISEIVTGQKVTVGPSYYERSTGPLFAALLLLMGIAPLSAWGHSTVKTLGRALWKPLVASVLVVIGLWLSGVRAWSALLAFWLVALVTLVTLYEYYRAVVARHRRTGENYLLALWNLAGRNRRRYGGYIIHLGVVLMALGIIGIELFQTETQGTVQPGGSIRLGDYTMLFQRLDVFDTQDGRNVARAVVSVFKGDRFVGELHPRRDFFYDSQQTMTIPGVRSTMEDDFYVILVDWQSSAQGITFKVYHNPLVNWLWLGGLVFILGTLVAAWPDREGVPARARASQTLVTQRVKP
ncbi:heme lyase CcmF/NrfE family subunit [Thermanaerothrix sp. 4228-RoL]|uniref:Heme lyase CcmF/NrfE family subunit n=2 Tax=Thermanaerothrix TaxID=1077886 RepID=A0ABU3NNT0_9CHLR|nr:heme lyase CcmF/NrfE family subunit [Thermanaerothrix sp. 4228-RoL]MDT8897843.1 heme lyase CcmF/NrfE family subunit [Thermanaerothrix sp. 4228-RoL]